MKNKVDICVVFGGLLALLLVVYGFYLILKKSKANETDGQGLQRQLKGFALLVLAGIVNTTVLMLCNTTML